MGRIKIKNSTVNITVNLKSDKMTDEIERFDLSTKTPIDCMEFIKNIKKKIRDGTF